MFTNLSASIVERLLTVDAEAEEHGVPGQITEAPKLLQLDVAGGIPELDIGTLFVDCDALVEELIFRRFIMLGRAFD